MNENQKFFQNRVSPSASSRTDWLRPSYFSGKTKVF